MAVTEICRYDVDNLIRLTWTPDASKVAFSSVSNHGISFLSKDGKIKTINANRIFLITFTSIIFDRTGNYLASISGFQGIVSIWSVNQGELCYLGGFDYNTSFSGQVCTISWSPCGNFIAVAWCHNPSHSNYLDIIGITRKADGIIDFQWRKGVRLGFASHGVNVRVAFNPRSDELAVDCGNGKIAIFDCRSLEMKYKASEPYLSNGLNGLYWSPCGRRLLTLGAKTGSEYGEICLWETLPGERPRHLRSRLIHAESASWHPSGSTIAIGCYDGLHIFSGDLKTELQYFKRKAAFNIAWNPLGDILVTMDRDRNILRFWRSLTDTLIGEQLCLFDRATHKTLPEEMMLAIGGYLRNT